MGYPTANNVMPNLHPCGLNTRDNGLSALAFILLIQYIVVHPDPRVMTLKDLSLYIFRYLFAYFTEYNRVLVSHVVQHGTKAMFMSKTLILKFWNPQPGLAIDPLADPPLKYVFLLSF